MKEKFDLIIGKDGSIKGIYQDGLPAALCAEVAEVKRASNVEFETDGPESGWTVRAAHDPSLAIRWTNVGLELDFKVAREGPLVFFVNREEALEKEVKYFWQLLEESKPE